MESAACGVGRSSQGPTGKQRTHEERDGFVHEPFPFPKDVMKPKCNHIHGYYASAAPYSKKSPWNNYKWNYYHGGNYFPETWPQWGAYPAGLPSCEYNQATSSNYQRWARRQQQQRRCPSFSFTTSPQEEMRTMQQAASSSRSQSQFPCYIPPPLVPLHDVTDGNYCANDAMMKMPPPLLPLPGIGFDPQTKATVPPAAYPQAQPKMLPDQTSLPARLPSHPSLKDGAASYQYQINNNHAPSAFPAWTPEIRSVEPSAQQCKSQSSLYRRSVTMPATPWAGHGQSSQPALPSLVPLPGTVSHTAQQHHYYPPTASRQCSWNSHINLHYPSEHVATNSRQQDQMTPSQYSDCIPCINPIYSDMK